MRNDFARLICFVSLCLAIASISAVKSAKPARTPASPESQNSADIKFANTIVYKQVGDTKLDMAMFPPLEKKLNKTPLLVYIHGGGWTGGSKAMVTRHSHVDVIKELCKAGVTCVSIEYRLVNPKTQSTVMESIADCKDAIHFLVKNAASYNLDPDRIARITSPVLLLKKDSPAIFLAHGDQDRTLSFKNSITLRDAAQAKGVPVECVISKGANHGFGGGNIDPSIKEINKKTVDFLLNYLTK